jgi:hypothetical protein
MIIDRRRRDEPDPLLAWKLRIFFAGAVLLGASVLLKREVLTLAAAVVLGAGMVLVLITLVRQRRREDERIAEHEET